MKRTTCVLVLALGLAACGGGKGMSEQGNGVLKDAATGLEWTQRDNGADRFRRSAGILQRARRGLAPALEQGAGVAL